LLLMNRSPPRCESAAPDAGELKSLQREVGISFIFVTTIKKNHGDVGSDRAAALG